MLHKGFTTPEASAMGSETKCVCGHDARRHYDGRFCTDCAIDCATPRESADYPYNKLTKAILDWHDGRTKWGAVDKAIQVYTSEVATLYTAPSGGEAVASTDGLGHTTTGHINPAHITPTYAAPRPEPGEPTEAMVDDAFILAVEEEVGMGNGAWDMVKASDICRAVLKIAAARGEG